MSGSDIKGGGRAAMSPACEDAVVSLLRSLRGDNTDMPTQHDREREHRRFMKRLVEQYERKKLHERLNKQRNESSSTNANNGATNTSQPAAFEAGDSQAIDGNAKVRIELVEATLANTATKDLGKQKKKGGKSSSDKKKKDKSSSKKNDPLGQYKLGTKKVMVLPRSTSIDQLLTQSKNKLRLKQKPVRCFCIAEKSKIEADLLGYLRGVADGTTLYVSSSQSPSSKPDDQGDADDNKGDGSSSDAVDVVDPLDAVKETYIRQKQLQIERRRKSQQQGKSTTISKKKQREGLQEHPQFSNFFDKLSPIKAPRSELPAAACRESFLTSVEQNRVVIVCGSTGCGKSSQLPQFLLDGMIASNCRDQAHIIVTQPRRVAATSLAHRVAYEMNSSPPGRPGSTVGYQVRLDRRIADDTAKIVYCTVGILLRMLVCPQQSEEIFDENDDDDRTNAQDGQMREALPPPRAVPLSNVSHVVIDEVHERDLNTDFVLTLIRNLLSLNPHIRIILMSATASADLFVHYFTKNNKSPPEVLSIPGRSYPVDIKWMADCERFASVSIQGWTGDDSNQNTEGNAVATNDSNRPAQFLSPRATDKIDNKFIKNLITTIIQQQQEHQNSPPGNIISKEDYRKDGAILVFLPGKAEIESLERILRDNESMLSNRKIYNIFKLHSTIPRKEQDEVFHPAIVGTFKIVLTTNLAETSITIPDVSHVIDAGRVKESRFNASTRIKELITVWTSQASAKQRAGRAGRTTAGVCWRLYSEEFFGQSMPPQTSPEMLRTPLDELILQLCLLYEQRRDETRRGQATSPSSFPAGVSPVKFLSNTPEPPLEMSIMEACNHLLEVNALHAVDANAMLYRLTPLGYHLSRLPMDAKVGKVLIVGCILNCLDPALTIAATLSHTKSCFSPCWSNCNVGDWAKKLEARKTLVESGFGGQDWKGGTVKGDLIACIAAYDAWSRKTSHKERVLFCTANALDNTAFKDIHSLRSQFKDYLVDAGFVEDGGNDSFESLGSESGSKDDALLTSCCLVAGLYPNIATLMRPRKGGFRAGRLLTKDADVCRPSSSSFQMQRVKNASESGKDAYAVYHAKHRTLGTTVDTKAKGEVFLNQVNFVSRFTLLLFGGELEIRDNAVIVDKWLKFKVGDKGVATAILLLELRDELDKVLLKRISLSSSQEGSERLRRECEQILRVVRLLLKEE